MTDTDEDIKHWGHRYIYLDKIGKGSYGVVFKVKDTKGSEGQDGIKVLKEIPIDSMNQDEIDECTREGKLLSKLKHSYIIQYADSFSCQGNYCIITEFCEGGDLKKVIESTKKSGKHLEELRIIRWFIQILQGLVYIHKRKILHRDLKPNNIFLKSDSVKIGDFGISRILNFTMDLASTFLGTPYYMSPEVLKHEGYNTMSDIWSVGVILYEMCALKHAFTGNNIMDVMMKILDEPCPEIPSTYSTDLQNVIESILIKDPNKRPSAQEILDLPYIKLKIRDLWMDTSDNDDLSETIVKKERDDISSYLSKSIDLKIMTDDSIKLTPKQKLQLKKDREAQRKAEAQKAHIQKTYKEDQEMRKKFKKEQFQESLPFANRRSETSRSSISEYDELNSSRNSVFSGSKTVIPPIHHNSEKYNRLSQTEKIQKHFDKNYHDQIFEKTNDVTTRNNNKNNNNNQNGLFGATYSNLIFDDQSNCKITTYDAVNDPLNQENQYQYTSDFESDSSTSVNSRCDQNDEDESLDDTVAERFQDNIETDPYGISVKEKKIITMRKKCLEKIDEHTMEKALKYLKEYNGKDYTNGLIKICKGDNDIAMTVDQLYFLTNSKNTY